MIDQFPLVYHLIHHNIIGKNGQKLGKNEA